MKKITILLICSLLAVATIFAGGESEKVDSDKDGVADLTLWFSNRALDDGILAEVNQEFPNVNLRPEKIGEMKTKIIATMAAGSGMPDIVYLNDWIGDFYVSSEKFVNLFDSPYNAGELEDMYYDWKWANCVTPDGETLMALPIDIGPTALFYRSDLFKEAGLPYTPEDVEAEIKNWDDLIEAGVILKEKTGVSMFENAGRIFTYGLSQLPYRYFNEEGEFIADQAHVKECFDRAVKAQKLGIVYGAEGWTPEWNAAIDNGDIASFNGAFWMKKILRDAGQSTAGKWSITHQPGGPGNNGGSFLAISAESDHKEEAFEVVKWLVSPMNQRRHLDSDSNLFPSTPLAFENYTSEEDEFFGGQKTNDIFIEASESIPTTYYYPKDQVFQEIFQNELKMVADTNKDPEKAWNDAIRKCKFDLNR